MNYEIIDGFEPARQLGLGDISIPVYTKGNGNRCLIIIHELPGMTPEFIEYCRRMANEGFKVYMPLLFKKPNTKMGIAKSAAFCMSREFRLLFSRKNSEDETPFSNWLLKLCKDVYSINQGSRIGVVGMCLTGGFALVTISDINVEAAVACQPSFPFFTQIHTLGLSSEQRQRVSSRASSLEQPIAKGYRYKKDLICRPAHMNAAKELLGNAIETHPEIPGFGHSTLTNGSDENGVFADSLEFLRMRMP